MATEGQHLSAVQKNIRFLNRSEEHVAISRDFPEWSTVIRFYVCVHIIEAALTPDHCESHEERRKALLTDKGKFNLDFRNRYNDLYQHSRRARYLNRQGYSISIDDLADADAAYLFIISHANTEWDFKINKDDK